MALFEYFCEECNITFEKIIKNNTRDEERPCPKCGDNAKKIISSPNFKVNGHNYKNGYGLHQ